MSLVDLKNIKKPEVEVEDINSMTKEELLYHIITKIEQDYSDKDLANRAAYSTAKNFYEGMCRGYWECLRTIKEMAGRLDA